MTETYFERLQRSVPAEIRAIYADDDMSSAERSAQHDREHWRRYLREWDDDKDHWPSWYWEQERQRRVGICDFWDGVIARIRELEGK